MPESSPATVVMMCGIAGSGKTTYAQGLEAQGYVRLSIDEQIWATAGRYGVDYPSERYAELGDAVEVVLRARLIELIEDGRDVVVDFSFWNRARRDEYKRVITDAGGRWQLVHLDVPADELRRRLADRAQRFDANAAFPVDEQLFGRYLSGFEPPVGEGETVVRPGQAT